MEMWVGSALLQGQSYWQQQSWEAHVGKILGEVAFSPITEPVDSRTGLPQAKQLRGRERSPFISRNFD